jgi:hypothetical protein
MIIIHRPTHASIRGQSCIKIIESENILLNEQKRPSREWDGENDKKEGNGGYQNAGGML